MARRDSLEKFHELEASDDQGATSLADKALGGIAETGRVHHQWNHLKPVLSFKLKRNLKLAFSDLGPSGSGSGDMDQCDELLERLAGFANPPFTIQRLCELLVFPCKHYNRTDKYLRALERVLMVVTCTEPELVAEQRVPPLTSVPTEELTGGGGGEESGGCTSPSGVGSQDSRGGCKRELATVELQEADSTVEGVEDDSETPTKRIKWDLASPDHSPQVAARDSEMDTTLGGLSTEALPVGRSTEVLPVGVSTEALPVGVSTEALPVSGSTGSSKGQAPTGESGHGDMGLDVSVPDHSASQTCSGVEEPGKQQPMEVGEPVGRSASDTEPTQPADRHLA